MSQLNKVGPKTSDVLVENTKRISRLSVRPGGSTNGNIASSSSSATTTAYTGEAEGLRTRRGGLHIAQMSAECNSP
jgi:hypothetical protein